MRLTVKRGAALPSARRTLTDRSPLVRLAADRWRDFFPDRLGGVLTNRWVPEVEGGGYPLY
jgi:hypothetical protein